MNIIDTVIKIYDDTNQLTAIICNNQKNNHVEVYEVKEVRALKDIVGIIGTVMPLGEQIKNNKNKNEGN